MYCGIVYVSDAVIRMNDTHTYTNTSRINNVWTLVYIQLIYRVFKSSSLAVQASEHILHASVLSMVEFDDDIFAAGHCFDWNQHITKVSRSSSLSFSLPLLLSSSISHRKKSFFFSFSCSSDIVSIRAACTVHSHIVCPTRMQRWQRIWLQSIIIWETHPNGSSWHDRMLRKLSVKTNSTSGVSVLFMLLHLTTV